jgi:hypothetical protein
LADALQPASLQLPSLPASSPYALRDMDDPLPSVLDPYPLARAYDFHQNQLLVPSSIYVLRREALNFRPL